MQTDTTGLTSEVCNCVVTVFLSQLDFVISVTFIKSSATVPKLESEDIRVDLQLDVVSSLP